MFGLLIESIKEMNTKYGAEIALLKAEINKLKG
jgi:hypothetical protein